MAENSTPVPPTETGAIVTASLENGIINGEAGSAGVASAGILPSVNSVAEGGPAILLLVALALMAAVLLGRRNNGGA